jgi:PAS domain S-box-containing protein/diguanylate cyclase (GGDEF)-like protein
MSSHSPQPALARRRFFSFLAAISPLRYGVVAVIVVTVGYTFLRVFPMLRHNLELLRNVSAVDEQGMRLEGDLQVEIQESRRRFLRAMLAAGDPAETAEARAETQSVRVADAAVASTEAQIVQLGAAPAASQALFHASWLGYTAERDKRLASALKGDPKKVLGADADLAQGAFATAELAARNAETALEASSARQIGEASTTLHGTLQEVEFLVLVKIFALSLLLWTDWKRIRAEKQLRVATHELQASEDRFRQAYETAGVGMGIFKLDGTVVAANAKAAEILGYEIHELIGMKVSDFMAPECVDDHLHKLDTLPRSEENHYHAERRVLRKDGREAWVRNSVTLFRPAGQEPYYFSLSEEITQQRQAHDRLAFLANFDPVTDLPNRRYFERHLAAALDARPENSDGVALMYLEIDSFDFLKGTFGRTVADEVLSEIGRELAAFRRPGEVVGRLDDHVFGVILPAALYDEATMARAAALRAIFHRAGEAGKHNIPLSASIGIAYSGETADGESGCGEPGTESKSRSEALLKFGRAAMLEARSRGGDAIFVADPALQERAAERHQIEVALLRGLREDEFEVIFQPQFEIATGNLVRFEALCRWKSAELGTIPPDRFIPIAEQTGLIMEIGRRIMHEALRQAKSWTESGRRIGIAVNVSPMQFMRPDFTQVITEILTELNFPPALLELEITEGIFIRDLNLAVVRIHELRLLGLSIALDDFGTGYSSLSYLQRMPIDAVKLDRSFVSDLATDAATVSMVRSVLAMAKALHLRVTTEGVETEQQLDILRTLGCDEAQGYLLGRPEPAEMALQRVLESPLRTMGTVA